jgi:hypothetical protein
VSFGHQFSNTKLMKIMCIYSPLISPPVTPRTSNKLNEVDSIGWEWFRTARLQWRVAEGVMMLRETSKHKKIDTDGHFTGNNSPRMNQTWRIRSVVGGFGPLACVDGPPQVRLMYLILFFAHKNRDNKTNTHLLLPKMPLPLL